MDDWKAFINWRFAIPGSYDALALRKYFVPALLRVKLNARFGGISNI
jgi:hypothetical protein